MRVINPIQRCRIALQHIPVTTVSVFNRFNFNKPNNGFNFKQGKKWTLHVVS